jgi:predicted tellurium resistance membrane protein TerC
MNFINDIDNILIIAAVIRKNGFQIKSLLPYIVLCLTITRTLYVMVIHSLLHIPGLRVTTGILLLCMAIRSAWTINSANRTTSTPAKSIIRIMLLVIVTDFAVCLDSVTISAELSSNLFFILVGIFLSVATVFIIFDSFSEVLANTSWIQIIASGLIGHMTVLSMVKDPVTENLISFIEWILEVDIERWINVFSLDIAIIIVIIGIMKRLQNRNAIL